MATFFDMLNITDVQRATAQTRTLQQARHLAVMPKPALAPIVESGLRREVVGQRLATERRRTDLAENAYDFRRRQFPYAVGLGALNLGVNVLGGLRARQLQQQGAAQYAELAAIRRQGLAQQREATRRILDIYENQVGQLNQSYLPLNPPPAGAGSFT